MDEHKAMEALLKQMEQRYKTVVNALFPNFLFLFDKNFVFQDIILPDGLNLFHNREELIGTSGREFYSPDVSDLFVVNIRECLEKNIWKEIEYHIDLFGTRFFYKARIVPLEDEKVICLIQDIGDRVRRMEEMMAQRRRAEESDKMKTAFIANMSHEIRTPLNAILGFTDFIINETDPEKNKHYSEIIRANSDLLLQIVSDVLDLSRIESGMSELQITKVDVSGLMEELMETFMTQVKDGVRLIVELPETDIAVQTDRKRLFQILSNLVSNAIKNTDTGDIVVLLAEEGEMLRFIVKDTGKGIPEDKVKSIFERFEKLDHFVQGAGLGLSISKAIVEMLGGTIDVESQVGQGSTFSFTIPFRTSDNAKIGSMMELMNKPKAVMVIVPQEDDYRLISEMLKDRYDTLWVADSSKAVSVYILDNPELILIDTQMSDSGDSIRKIRALSTVTPIIAVTSNDFYHDQRWALENGCTDVLAKPYSSTKLIETIMAYT